MGVLVSLSLWRTEYFVILKTYVTITGNKMVMIKMMMALAIFIFLFTAKVCLWVCARLPFKIYGFTHTKKLIKNFGQRESFYDDKMANKGIILKIGGGGRWGKAKWKFKAKYFFITLVKSFIDFTKNIYLLVGRVEENFVNFF